MATLSSVLADPFDPQGTGQKLINQKKINDNQQLAQQAGVSNPGYSTVNAGGLTGFFGDTKDIPEYTAQLYDPSLGTSGLKSAVTAEQQRLMSQAPIAGPAGATVGKIPQMQTPGQIDNSGMGQLSQMLFDRANGNGPTAADAQFRQQSDQNMQQALAMAAAAPGHGGNYSAALKNAMNQRAGMTQQAALGAGQLRAQEQQAATGQLGQVLGQQGEQAIAQRGQDIGVGQSNLGAAMTGATTNAQLAQQANLAGYQGDIQQRQDLSNRMTELMKLGYTADQAYFNALTQQTQFNAGLLAQQEAAGQGVGVQNQGQSMQAGGAAIGALGSVLAAAV